MKNPFLTSALSAGLIVLVGCETMYNMMDALNEAHTYNSSAIAGGGAVAGKDYITGLAPCEESRAYFAKSSSSQTEKVTVTPGNDKGTGVEWTDDGGIVIPPGVTIEFVNNGYCMDPHLPAPKSGEEIQLVKTASLLPNKMRGTYKNLMQRAAAGDEEIKSNMQRLVWALRTAGSVDAMATYLTDRQKEILEENASNEYEGIDSFDGLFDKLVDDAKKQLAQTIADVTSVRIGNVTYNAFDLMDPDKGMEKVAAHMDALAAMSKNLPVAKTGFNYGQIENGIYTDIKGGSSDAPASGNGWLTFTAKIANATSQSYTFYPLDYVGQVGSGDNSSAGTFYATSSTSMRQRICISELQSVCARTDVVVNNNPRINEGVSNDKKEIRSLGSTQMFWDSLSHDYKQELAENAMLAQAAYDDNQMWAIGDYRQVSVGRTDYQLGSKVSSLIAKFKQAASTDKGLSLSIFEKDGEYTVAFRGTEVKDWNDLSADKALLIGRDHEQFQIASEIIANIADASGRPVNLTGHSLGGYLATIAALNNADKIGMVYTFNSPGLDAAVLSKYDDNNKREISAKTTNLWHSNDFVHTVNDSYVGDAVAVDGSRHIGRNIEMINYAGLGDRTLQVLSAMTGFGSTVYDHSIDTLVKRIQANLE